MNFSSCFPLISVYEVLDGCTCASPAMVSEIYDHDYLKGVRFIDCYVFIAFCVRLHLAEVFAKLRNRIVLISEMELLTTIVKFTPIQNLYIYIFLSALLKDFFIKRLENTESTLKSLARDLEAFRAAAADLFKLEKASTA